MAQTYGTDEAPEVITLYGAHISHACNAVAIALLHKELRFELVEPPGSGYHEGRFKPGYGTEPYRALMHPVPPTIPAIIAEWEGGERTFKLNESSTIIEFCNDLPSKKGTLFPGDSLIRARTRHMIRMHDIGLDPKVRALFPLVANRDDEADLAAKLQSTHKALASLATLVDSIDGAAPQFLNGFAFSAADCTLLPTFVLLHMILTALEGKPPTWPGKRLGEWYEAIQEHPAVSAVMAEAHPSTAEWVRRKAAAEPFGDGWWRPEGYGRQRNISFPQ